MTFAAGQALAQAAPAVPPPPVFPATDEIGVDLTSGRFTSPDVDASVGPLGEGGLARLFRGEDARDNLAGSINTEWRYEPGYPNLAIYAVSVGGSTAKFLQLTPGGAITPEPGSEGESLSFDGAVFTYTSSDGTLASFTSAKRSPAIANTALLDRITKPSGEVLTYAYSPIDPSCADACSRIDAVTSNLGYMIKYEYAGSGFGAGGGELKRVVAVNLAVEFCDGTAASCTLSNGWSSTSYRSYWDTDHTVVEATDALGRITKYWIVQSKVTRVIQPSGIVTAIGYGPDGRVSQVTAGPGTWTYTYTTLPSGNIRTDVSGPGGATRSVETDAKFKRVVASTDGLGRTTSYTLDPNRGLITRVTRPEGNAVEYVYDARGNIQTATEVAKPGSGLASRITHVGLEAGCLNPKTCNKPLYVEVGGSRVDYSYDGTHGQLTTITGPADQHGVRAQTRYRYEPRFASYYVAPGVVQPAAAPVYKLTEVSTCLTGASCLDTSDEARTVFERGGAGSNNLQVTGITDRDGAGTVSAHTELAYNVRGDVRTVDGPLPGPGDTTRNRWTTERELESQIDPDPDGQGAGRPATARRYGYTPDGVLSYVQYGTVPSQSDADWLSGAFTRVLTEGQIFDDRGRVVQIFRRTFDGGVATDRSLTQQSYDAAGRLECSAVRMNPAAFTNLPASACELGSQGEYGPDRITRIVYDSANRPTSVTSGFGTGDASVEQASYTANGLVETRKDANGNVTTYVYDGHDRPSEVRYPHKDNGAQSSVTDVDRYTYDPSTWNLSHFQRRGGLTADLTYDARGRMISTSLPGATSYDYDNLDRPISVTEAGRTVTATFDALGRQTSAGGWFGQVGYQYDPAGRRKRLTWPDGYFVTYDYDAADHLSAIRDGGEAAMVTFDFDSMGRRKTLSRANGSTTSYTYDGLSRLTELGHNLSGGAQDLILDFQFNPADQIATRSSSNAVYDWAGTRDGGTYAVNGLNQYVTAAGRTPAHDSRGNVTSDGQRSFSFDAGDRLISTGALTLSYDPVDRLEQIVNSGASTRLVYDGSDLIAEYDPSGVTVRRFIHGPGTDEPLVTFEGPGLATRSWTAADERGSIIALTDAGGAAIAINSYDEYGLAGAGNQGRFQYTGQLRLPGTNLYHYKARAYSPELGRFLQTDPIGYLDGLNLYAYGHNDPINEIDPYGTDGCGPHPSGCVSQVVVTAARQVRDTAIERLQVNLAPATLITLQVVGDLTNAIGSFLPQDPASCARSISTGAVLGGAAGALAGAEWGGGAGTLVAPGPGTLTGGGGGALVGSGVGAIGGATVAMAKSSGCKGAGSGGGDRPQKAERPSKAQIEKEAKDLGYSKVKGLRKHGQDVFQKGNRFISRDVDAHRGGTWKMFERKGGELQRMGTYDAKLARIAD